jgi:hypothetical protein
MALTSTSWVMLGFGAGLVGVVILILGEFSGQN